MRIQRLIRYLIALGLIPLAMLAFPSSPVLADVAARLDGALQGQHRDPKNVARDVYRHPKETLLFFDVRPHMKVLEILPGAGWYTEILAVFLRDAGELTVASFGDDHPTRYLRNIHRRFIKKLEADPGTYGKVKPVLFEPSGYLDDVPDASVDRVLTFRNTHNWIRYGGIEDVYAALHRVLKPGGILGVVQHRAPPGSNAAETAERGYVPEKMLIAVAEAAGFELIDKSELNANPKDTKDYPEGVWSLPPTYREKNRNRNQYTAIGESDRMTLKFIKLP